MIGNNSFVEDSGQYKIIPLRDSCNDDRTLNDELNFSVTTNPIGVVEAIVEDGHLKIFQIEDSYGVSEVTVTVFDTSGNSWIDSFLVEVLEVNDPPVILDFPDEVWIEFGKTLIVNGTLFDSETLLGDLDFNVDHEIAVINSDNTITLSPIDVGIVEVNLLLSDDDYVTSHKIIVNTFTESELEPISIIIKDDEGLIVGNNQYISDSIVSISTVIENYGTKEATFVSVRYYLDDEMIGNITIPSIAAGSSQIVELSNWNLKGSSGNYVIKVVVDSNDLIQESNELNNEITLDFRIIESQDIDGTSSLDSRGLMDGPLISFFILFGFIFISLALFFGPKKIQRIK